MYAYQNRVQALFFKAYSKKRQSILALLLNTTEVNKMQSLRNALKELNSFHADFGNLPRSQQKDALTLLHSARFTIDSLIKLLGGQNDYS